MYDMYPALVPVFSASAQAFSSAALRTCSLSATMRWLASDTCAPAPKFCRYAVYAATVPVFSASAQAFSSASLRVCSSAACCCCCAAVCCESEGWLQAEMRAAPAMAPTNAHFANATRLADLGFRGGSPFMAVLLWLQRPTPPRLQCPP